jgi:VWFA-related protein
MISSTKGSSLAVCCCLLMVLSSSRIAGQQKPGSADEKQVIRLDATLTQVPTVVTDKTGRLVTDLSRNDFRLSENGKRQDISVFSTIDQPFHAVLLLDTSNSAEDRLRAIKRCALDFGRLIKPADKLMVISFDNEIHKLTDFTSDQKELEDAINSAEAGFGKFLHEGIAYALKQLKDVEGRRAVILFSDGVDLGSIDASSESTIRDAEEIGAVIYAIQFETRWWVESTARKQKAENPGSTLPISVDGRIPLPPDFGGPDLTPPGMPKPNKPRIEVNGRPRPPIITIDGKRQVPHEAPDEMAESFDKLYGTADKYLRSITSLTGGLIFNADSFDLTQSAFNAIAEELRKQYLIGYYSSNDQRDGKYRKIKVEVSRSGLSVRARPGYRR